MILVLFFNYLLGIVFPESSDEAIHPILIDLDHVGGAKAYAQGPVNVRQGVHEIVNGLCVTSGIDHQPAASSQVNLRKSTEKNTISF